VLVVGEGWLHDWQFPILFLPTIPLQWRSNTLWGLSKLDIKVRRLPLPLPLLSLQLCCLQTLLPFRTWHTAAKSVRSSSCSGPYTLPSSPPAAPLQADELMEAIGQEARSQLYEYNSQNLANAVRLLAGLGMRCRGQRPPCMRLRSPGGYVTLRLACS